MLRIIAIAALAIGTAVAETSLPKGAVEIEPGVYKHTDAQGKTQFYRKTPFGVNKVSEESLKQGQAKAQPSSAEAAKGDAAANPFGASAKAPAERETWKVTDRGDVLEFERPGPFGGSKWKRKKDELTPAEREAWDQSRQQTRQQTTKTAGTKE